MPENVDPRHGAGGKLATTSSTNSLGLHESGVHVNLGTEDDEDNDDGEDDDNDDEDDNEDGDDNDDMSSSQP